MAKPKTDILTIADVAEYHTAAELYRLAVSKKIPAFKVGGTWRFTRADIDQWIKRQTSKTLGDDGSAASGGNS